MKKDIKYNIKDYGAATCDSLQTVAIRNTIDACFGGGGGHDGFD